MKKLFLATMVALTAMGANAQIARSTMFQAPERENNIMWYIRAGVSINNAAANGNLKDTYPTLFIVDSFQVIKTDMGTI